VESDDELQVALIRLKSFDFDSLARTGELGSTLGFGPLIPEFKFLVLTLDKIPVERIGELIPTHKNILSDAVNAIHSTINNISRFDPKSHANAADQRQQIIDGSRNTIHSVCSNLVPVVSILFINNYDPERESSKLKSSIDRVISESRTNQEEIVRLKDEAGAAVSAIRSAAAEAGVSQQASYYVVAADGHREAAGNWLVTSVLLLSSILLYSGAILYFAFEINTHTSQQIIQISLAKALIFSILLYGLFQSVKNYSAHKHNETVNRHRQNCLQSFNAIVLATGTEDKRDIVLASMANSIFSPQDTGFVRNGTNNLPNLISLVDSSPKTAG
jgi:hypothetical protein